MDAALYKKISQRIKARHAAVVATQGKGSSFPVVGIESLQSSHKSDTLFTGTFHTDVPSYAGFAEVNGAIAAVTDIDDPATTGGWTTLYSTTNATPFIVRWQRYHVTSAANWPQEWPFLFYLRIPSTETATVALRGQAIIDGNIVADIKIDADNANDQGMGVYAPVDTIVTGYEANIEWGGGGELFCQSELTLRFARQGALTAERPQASIFSGRYWYYNTSTMFSDVYKKELK